MSESNDDSRDLKLVVKDGNIVAALPGASSDRSRGDGGDGRSGGGSGAGGGMDQRVAALEKQVDKLDGKLDKLLDAVQASRLENEKRFSAVEGRLTGIEAKLDTRAAKSDLTPIEAKLGMLEGRVAGLPTIWAMMGIVGAFVIGIASVGFGVAKLMEKPAAVQPVSSAPPARSP